MSQMIGENDEDLLGDVVWTGAASSRIIEGERLAFMKVSAWS